MVMPENRSVQFLGVKNAVRAYKNMGIPNWAVVCGNDLLECYEDNNLEAGMALLTTYLTELAANRSNGYYSLRVYDDLPKNGRIRIKTEAARSFRFSLSEEKSSDTQLNREILERLERIESRQAVEMNDTEGEEKKDNSIGAMLSGLMETPEIKQAIGAGIAKVIEMFLKPITGMERNFAAPQPAAIGNAENPGADQVQKVQSAIEILWQVDPYLGDHLQSIASIAQTNPKKYQSLVMMLNSF
jgi:hypothetical protein